MDATRLISLAVFVLASVGLALVGRGQSWPLTVAGAFLMVGSALVFFRHFWRESDRKRKQDLGSLSSTLRSSSDELQDSHLALQAAIEATSDRIDVFSRGVLEYVAQLELDVKGATDTLDRRAARYRDHVLGQLSGVVGVYSVLKPSIPYPPFGGWAVGGDCAQRLVSHILASRPRWILEAGSGLSTILAAQALELIGDEGRVISFEHEAQWLERSKALVAEHGMSHRSEIFYTPLIDVTIEGEEFRWYDLSRVDLPEEVQLIFVDGPPKASGSLARYPALPMLHERLSPGGVMLMDDAGRPDERAAVERWQDQFPEWEFRFHNDSKSTVEIIKGKG